MKKISIFCAILGAVIFASCNNEPIEITRQTEVRVEVSLSKFFDQYNWYDTKHEINTVKNFTEFNTKHELYIQVRTLFYNAVTNQLVDSLVQYVTNTNDVSMSKAIPTGIYKAITTLCFAEKPDPEYTYWWMRDKDQLSTATLEVLDLTSTTYRRSDSFTILSVSEGNISVGSNSVTYRTTPEPVGSLVYLFFENFQYKNEATYGTIADNSIRALSLYTQQLAVAYKLDSGATNRYEYKKTTGTKTWKYIWSVEPSNFDKSWTYFKTNLYGFAYILAPECDLCFGYYKSGASGFTSAGEAHYTIQPGKVYLAYWDWFQVGNPYFGIANNNHWHTYGTGVKESLAKPMLLQ